MRLTELLREIGGPYFTGKIDVVCINAYRLYQLYTVEEEHRLSHLQFRIELYCKLLGHSKKANLQSLRVGLGGKRLFSPELQHLHYWERGQNRGPVHGVHMT
jgi:hypothetical protein